MKPIPHLVGSCLVVDIDFARGWVLLGELSRAGDSASSVYRHVRLRLVDGQWHRDRGERDSIPCPPMDAESYHWRPERQPLDRLLHIAPVPAPVIVERSALVRALDRAAKLCGRSLGVDGLLTVHVHERGLSLVSHGESSIVADVPIVSEGSARDGLGRVVVLGELLRMTAKDVGEARIEVVAEPRSMGRALIVHERRLWTADVEPVTAAAQPVASQEYPTALSDAVVRALAFACTDNARVNLCRVAFHGRGDHVIVESTDGHRLYRERVDGVDIFGENFYTVPQRVLAALRSGKRSGAYRFAVVDGSVMVTCDGVTVACRPSATTWPPCEQILTPVLREPGERSAYGWETRTLAGEHVNKLRAWARDQGDDTLTVQFADEPFAVQIDVGDKPSATFGGNTFAQLTTRRNNATPWNTARGVLAGYLADALAAFPTDSAVNFTVTADPESREPIYLTDDTRTTVVMPYRL